MRKCPKDVICINNDFCKAIDLKTGGLRLNWEKPLIPEVNKVYKALYVKTIRNDSFYHLEGFDESCLFTIKAFRDLDDINISEINQIINKNEEVLYCL